MDIKPVEISTLVAPTIPKPLQDQLQGTQNAAKQQPQVQPPTEVQDQLQVDSKNIKKSLNFMDNLRAVSDEINAYAKAVRHTDVILEKASNQIDLMKKPLETIIKNFPPYPPESSERAQLLKSYISLRKEIEKLTLPPPLDVTAPKLKQMFSDLFDQDGKFKTNEALDIPGMISPTATDRDIISVIDKLDTAKMQIDRGRVELSSSIK